MTMENHGGTILMGEKLLICQPELSSNPASSNLVAKQGELATEMTNFAL
jgi:hypothetical protein